MFGPLLFWVCLRPVTMKTRHIVEKAAFLQQGPEEGRGGGDWEVCIRLRVLQEVMT